MKSKERCDDASADVGTVQPPAIATELERTYLPRALPFGLQGCESESLVDMYFPIDVPNNAPRRLRLRQRGGRYEITKKMPLFEGDESAFSETTIPLTEAEFKDIATTSGPRLEKQRYSLLVDEHRAEVDVFCGQLAGLVLVDFEFQTFADRDNFRLPDICLAEVTQADFVAGGFLIGRAYSDIQKELEAYGYEPLFLV